MQADPAKTGLPKRTAWTTSRITGSPEPPLPYVAERVFPALKFNQCLDMTFAPGSERLFVLEQSGKLYSFPNVADVQSADLVFDSAKEIAGVQQSSGCTAAATAAGRSAACGLVDMLVSPF